MVDMQAVAERSVINRRALYGPALSKSFLKETPPQLSEDVDLALKNRIGTIIFRFYKENFSSFGFYIKRTGSLSSFHVWQMAPKKNIYELRPIKKYT